MPKQQMGLIGLAVMGKNLAFNIASRGYSLSVYNRTPNKTDELLSESSYPSIVGTKTMEEFVESLESPRKILMMVKAGEPVDQTINQLLPYLSEGDLLIDGGNSFYQDTIRRQKDLASKGFQFIGLGISGGEEGALHGPSLMPGGTKEAYELLEPLLKDISAKVDGEPCCTYIGQDGAGHFVKTVHNGIEYADMQLICEAYFIMKKHLKLTPPEIHNIFTEWNQGELNSYLIEITADIFTKVDPESGKYLVDVILDRAEQKGTGKWTSQCALYLQTATPTITTAVFERFLSSQKSERVLASKTLKGPKGEQKPIVEITVESIRKALYASKICAYAQGFSLLSAASKAYNWDLNLGAIAMIFRGGCIIRAQFLNCIADAYEKDRNLSNLLLDDYFGDIVADYQFDWRSVVIASIYDGISVPAFSSSLSYLDSYRSENLPANLLQAQRDYFGAHQYERNDKAGSFHTQW